jgi:glucose-6-phosphate 1-dehydrogenase
MDHTEYLKRVKSYIKTPTKDAEEQLESFCEACTYISGQYDQDEPFQQLDKHLDEMEKDRKEGNRVFYMALPPSVFITVSQHLKKNCYPKNGIARVIVSGDGTCIDCANGDRSRNRSARTWGAPANYSGPWNLTGKRKKSSA